MIRWPAIVLILVIGAGQAFILITRDQKPSERFVDVLMICWSIWSIWGLFQ